MINSSLKTLFLLLLLPFASAALAFSQGFSEVSIASGIHHLHRSDMQMGGGAAWFDMDRDGDEDLVMTGGLNGEGLYRNDGNGLFTEVTYAAGLGFMDSVGTMGVVTGDMDNDGYRELFFTTAFLEHNYLLYNNGNGTFTDISVAAGIAGDTVFNSSATMFDYEHDGDLDIYVGSYVIAQHTIQDTFGNVIAFDPLCAPNKLYRNDGNLQFTEIAMAVGLADSGCALAVADTKTGYVWDRDQAIYIANDFGQFHVPNQFYVLDEGSNNVTNPSAINGLDVGMYGMGIAQADYDHDGDLDYYVTDIGPNKLMNFDWPTGTYSDRAALAGVRNGTLLGLNTTGWGTAFLDYDNDTWQDLYACNGLIDVLPFIANNTKDPDKLYHNSGNGTFADVTMAQGIADSGWGRGMIVGDYDLDGDQDVLTMVIDRDTASVEHSKLWRNDQNTGHHWVNIKLEGTHFNPRDPFGAYLAISTPSASWMQYVCGGGSHMSQNSSIVHIGLGTDTTFQMTLYWPSSPEQYFGFGNLPIDSTYTILEDSTQFVTALHQQYLPGPKMVIYPNPTGGDWRLEMQHYADEDVAIEVWDMQGKLVFRRTPSMIPAGIYGWQFDAASLPNAGAYLVRLRSDSGQISEMLIRQ